MKQPAETVKVWPLDEILPYERNPRTHPDHQIELLARLMKEHGVDQPIVVDEHGIIIKGHGRLMAAKLAGMSTFPVVVKRGLSEDQKRAERIADNQVALLAGWNLDMIKLELGELTLAGYDMPLLGFDEAALAMFMDTNPGKVDPDQTPEAPTIPVSRTGDLWQLGRHRLLCGDATKADDVERVLGKSKPHLMVTDPPYGVEYDPAWRAQPGKFILPKKGVRKGAVRNDDRADWIEAWKLFPGEVAYVWHGGLWSAAAETSLHGAGFQTRAQIVWVKQHAPISRGHYHWRHECCWYVVREGKTGSWQGDRTQNTVWEINTAVGYLKREGAEEKTEHSTQKPVECMKRPIENNSKAGDAVYDPFVGSGSMLIAAEMTGRKALTIEIDPRYCDVVVERWQNFSGRKATLDGRTFEELAPERREANKDWKAMWGKPFDWQNEKRGHLR
jgi:DNA modification methylase